MITNRIKEAPGPPEPEAGGAGEAGGGAPGDHRANLEKGKYNPSLVLAWNIAQVFGVSIEEVFTVTPD